MHTGLEIELRALEAEIVAMVEENKEGRQNGLGNIYSYEHFMRIVKEIRGLKRDFSGRGVT